MPLIRAVAALLALATAPGLAVAAELVFQQGAPAPVTGEPYAGAQDAMIGNTFIIDQNFGRRDDFELASNGLNVSALRALLRFDVSSLAGARVGAARLELTVRSLRPSGAGEAPTVPNTIDAFQVLPASAGWVEGVGTTATVSPTGEDLGVTFNRKNQTSASPLAGTVWATPGLGAGTDRSVASMGSVSLTATERTRDVVVLPFNALGVGVVQGWLDGSVNGGLLLQARTEGFAAGGYTFHSSDAADPGVRPRLVLDVTVAGSGRFQVSLACPATARRGTAVGVVVSFRNTTPDTHTVTRGAVAMHSGELTLAGPQAVAIPAIVPPAAPGRPGVASSQVSVQIPPRARAGALVSIGLSAFGQAGAGGRRRLLGSDACAIEIER